MTLDTYTHLFEEARHGADVRAELAKSEFANLLSGALAPHLQAGEHLRSTHTATSQRRLTTPRIGRRCGPRTRPPRPSLLDQNLTNRFRQQAKQRV